MNYENFKIAYNQMINSYASIPDVVLPHHNDIMHALIAVRKERHDVSAEDFTKLVYNKYCAITGVTK